MLEGGSLSAGALECHPIPAPPAPPSSHLIPFLPISPPGNSCAKSLPSGSSLAAFVATGIYLPGSRITEERGRGSRLREDLGPGREDGTLRRVGAGPRLTKQIRAGEKVQRNLPPKLTETSARRQCSPLVSLLSSPFPPQEVNFLISKQPADPLTSNLFWQHPAAAGCRKVQPFP